MFCFCLCFCKLLPYTRQTVLVFESLKVRFCLTTVSFLGDWKWVGLRQWPEFLLSPCTMWSRLPDIFHMIYRCQKDRIFGICPIENSFFSSIYRLIYFKVALKLHWWKAYRWAETVVFNSSSRPFLHSRVKPLLNTKSKFSLA